MGIETAILGAGALGLGGALIGADQARSSSNKANDASNLAMRLALMPMTTGSSTINRGAGFASIDPRIRAMREQSLANIPGYRDILNKASGLYQTQLGDIQTGLAGNANAYRQARVNPLLQQEAQQSGATQMSQGLRGIGGSSFGDQALTNLHTDYGRAIGDQGALAANETLNAQTAIAGQQFAGAQAANQGNLALDQQYQSVAGQNLAQELAALGLSQADIGSILGAGGLASSAGQGYSQSIGRGLGSIGQLAYGLSPYMRQQPYDPWSSLQEA